jgi:hypothetical protein
MEHLINRGGRPRQYPPCSRYDAHRFSPKTGRCPCGFNRSGEMQPPRKETVVVSGIRLDANTYRVLGEISQRTGKSIAGLIRDAVARMLADDPSQGF